MKIIALVISLCALSQAATAQTPECKSIAKPSERLTCYDKVSRAEKSAPRSAAASAPSKDEPSKYVDVISAEDARMNARLKSICRGC